MRILLAEDEIELSNALVAILKHNNYSVDTVYNGRDAVDYIETGVYDCAVLDVMMPVMDGISALKEIRSKKIDIPVLILTAKSEIDDKVYGLDSGANDYLTKPFATKELLARLRVLTRKSNSDLGNEIVFSNMHLDREDFKLSVGNNVLRLNNKEFQMLEMFMQNPNKVISVDMFMEKIWGFDSDSEINVVWVYISNLRKKLASVNAKVKIKVSRNLGYYLEKTDD